MIQRFFTCGIVMLIATPASADANPDVEAQKTGGIALQRLQA